MELHNYIAESVMFGMAKSNFIKQIENAHSRYNIDDIFYTFSHNNVMECKSGYFHETCRFNTLQEAMKHVTSYNNAIRVIENNTFCVGVVSDSMVRVNESSYACYDMKDFSTIYESKTIDALKGMQLKRGVLIELENDKKTPSAFYIGCIKVANDLFEAYYYSRDLFKTTRAEFTLSTNDVATMVDDARASKRVTMMGID